jgi:hypothetical protein
MLSDQGADLVMSLIEDLTKSVINDAYVGALPAVANAMLNHLYDLHKLRDYEVVIWAADRFVARDHYTTLWGMY